MQKQKQFKWKSWFPLHLFLLLTGGAQRGARWSTHTSASRELPAQRLAVVFADWSAVACDSWDYHLSAQLLPGSPQGPFSARESLEHPGCVPAYCSSCKTRQKCQDVKIHLNTADTLGSQKQKLVIRKLSCEPRQCNVCTVFLHWRLLSEIFFFPLIGHGEKINYFGAKFYIASPTTDGSSTVLGDVSQRTSLGPCAKRCRLACTQTSDQVSPPLPSLPPGTLIHSSPGTGNNWRYGVWTGVAPALCKSHREQS